MAPRTTAQRVADTLRRLEHDADLWIATASDGRPWLVPLSFHWTGSVILMATSKRNPTYRNLEASGQVRLALGLTREVSMIDGYVDLPAELPDDEAEVVARTTGVDPRNDPRGGYIRVTPRRVQAWREYDETRDRTIMRDGEWLA